VVHAKKPFGGPQAVLAYLSRAFIFPPATPARARAREPAGDFSRWMW
jgi:hypothetical protein